MGKLTQGPQKSQSKVQIPHPSDMPGDCLDSKTQQEQGLGCWGMGTGSPAQADPDSPMRLVPCALSLLTRSYSFLWGP